MKQKYLLFGVACGQMNGQLVRKLSQRHLIYGHIVAPHQLHSSFLTRIRSRFPNQVLCYSTYEEDHKSNISSSKVLLIDSIGMLSRLYRYADLAYVGGGKRGALHNILEPAVYGVPVLFWAHRAHIKFPEAEGLRQCGGATVVDSTKELLFSLKKWSQSTEERKQASRSAAKFVAGRLGATQKIYEYIKSHPSFKKGRSLTYSSTFTHRLGR